LGRQSRNDHHASDQCPRCGTTAVLSLKTAAAALNDSDALTYSPQGFRKVQPAGTPRGCISAT
jgi:hypothetical protein